MTTPYRCQLCGSNNVRTWMKARRPVRVQCQDCEYDEPLGPTPTEMKAGCELDAQIARKVKGWKVCPGRLYVGKLDADYAMCAGIDPGRFYENILSSPDIGPGKSRTPRPVPPYSTDRGTAMELLDGFKKWTLLKHGPDFQPRYRCDINTGDGHVTAEADKAEHAICLAVLKTVEGVMEGR